MPEYYGTALQRIRALLEPIGSERITIEQALGRIPARDLVAPFAVPAFSISTRDGYALRAADTQGASATEIKSLQITGASFPDTDPSELPALRPGTAMAIATGAPLPSGADTILVVEKAVELETKLHITAPSLPGGGIRLPGDDIRDGSPLVTQGVPLTASQLGLLSAAGLSHIEAYRIPTVAIISTGNEILSDCDGGLGRKPPNNAIGLSAWCKRFGIKTKRWVATDDMDVLSNTIDEALADCDAIITIGGSGPGKRDLVFETLEKKEWEVLQEGVRLRPGWTTCFGLIGDKPIFLLPGPPAANETAFLMLALPGLLSLAGSLHPPFPLVPARLSRDLHRSSKQRRWTQVVRVQLSYGNIFLEATPLVGKRLQERVGRQLAFADANGILLLEEEENPPRQGDVVNIIVLGNIWVSENVLD